MNEIQEFITGIGGVFFKSSDVQKQKDFFETAMGLKIDQYGKTFLSRDIDEPRIKCVTQFSIMPADTDYFGRSDQQFMINFRVKNMEKLIEHLNVKNIPIAKPLEEYEYGKFLWVEDSDGNRIELWEPANEDLLS